MVIMLIKDNYVSISRLDNDSVRIGVLLRLRLQICDWHKCRCGFMVVEYARHPLFLSPEGLSFPSTFHPQRYHQAWCGHSWFPSLWNWIDVGNNKRCDDVTVLLFRGAKSFIWDSTCSDNFFGRGVTWLNQWLNQTLS